MSPKQVFADAVARQNELWRIIRVLERERPLPTKKVSSDVDDDDTDAQGARSDNDAADSQSDEACAPFIHLPFHITFLCTVVIHLEQRHS